jgi:hypothetical protein
MELQTLQDELARRAIVLSLDNGKLTSAAPQGAITPDIMTAIKEHRRELVTALAQAKEQSPPARAVNRPALRASRTHPLHPCRQEIELWDSCYGKCTWYDKVDRSSPFWMALEWACSEDYALCNLLATNRLIWFYERCSSTKIHTNQGVIDCDPHQYTQLLREACEAKDTISLLHLANNFVEGVAAVRIQQWWEADAGQVDRNEQENTAPSVRDQHDTSEEEPAPQQDTEQHQTATPKASTRTTVYVDWYAGQAVTDASQSIQFTPQCTLSELIAAVHQGAHTTRVFLCGDIPGQYETWLIDPGVYVDYSTAKRGHYFDREKAHNHVARYQQRISGHEIEIRTMYSWFGDTQYTVDQAARAMHLLEQYLAAFFTPQAKAYATPALTFQQLWALLNRVQGRSFEVLPEEIRAKIHHSSGQGRIELTTLAQCEKIPGLYYYDGIFMYSALTWGMPTEVALHDNKNEYAGKTPARYRIKYTVPSDWQHIGLFMTPKDAVTGNTRDRAAWSYPGENYQGRTFECWADGAELDVLIQHYAATPVDATKEEKAEAERLGQVQAFKAWDIQILERIVFKLEKDSIAKKPLDAITKRLTDARDKVDQDAKHDSSNLAIYRLVRGTIRNILLHGIGSFHRQERDITYILPIDEPAPDGYTHRREEGDLVWYSVPGKIEKYTQQFEHPEWTALIWARCRARMTRAALSLPREQIIALRTDAIALTHEQPQWNDNEKRGSLRQKWAIKKKLNAPHSFDALDKLIHQHVKGER